MNTQNHLVTRWLSRFFLGSFLLATLLLVSCGDDPEPANEEELITTLTLTLTPTGGDPITMTFKDLDGDGAGVPQYIYSTGGDAAVLSASTTYTAEITLLNESVNPAENITEEIEEEADEHLFCFTVGGGANIDYSYADEDDNGLDVGLTTIWETGAASTGTITIVLRHQPGTKTGACPGSGETDIEVTFNVAIQ
ncbi:MAG: hypothetical protein QY309_16800 [Cyclobacteriaceae bacterium]|nr:MAG: hypothetical protein QY309_16800 [Cyclobacteriaceae bacterium]